MTLGKNTEKLFDREIRPLCTCVKFSVGSRSFPERTNKRKLGCYDNTVSLSVSSSQTQKASKQENNTHTVHMTLTQCI